MNTYLDKIKGLREHDYAGSSLLPHQSPKFFHGSFGRSLSYDVGIGFQYALEHQKSVGHSLQFMGFIADVSYKEQSLNK